MAGVQTTTPLYNASFVGGVGWTGVVLLQQTIEMLMYVPLKKRRRAGATNFGVGREAMDACVSKREEGFVASTEGRGE
jgi:hypothetical protein